MAPCRATGGGERGQRAAGEQPAAGIEAAGVDAIWFTVHPAPGWYFIYRPGPRHLGRWM